MCSLEQDLDHSAFSGLPEKAADGTPSRSSWLQYVGGPLRA